MAARSCSPEERSPQDLTIYCPGPACRCERPADKVRLPPQRGAGATVHYANRCRGCGTEYSALQPARGIEARRQARRLARAGQLSLC